MNTDVLFLDPVRRMEEVSLAQVFDEYARTLYNYIVRLCSDPVLADNIVGDVFSKLLDQLSSGNGPTSNLRSYLFEAAYNLFIDQIRYNRRRMPLETPGFYLAEKHGIQQDIEQHIEQHILCDSVWHVIQNELTDCQRYVIILRFLEGFSIQETAQILGKSVANIKVIQHRAVKTLQASLFEWSMI